MRDLEFDPRKVAARVALFPQIPFHAALHLKLPRLARPEYTRAGIEALALDSMHGPEPEPMVQDRAKNSMRAESPPYLHQGGAEDFVCPSSIF